jgi:hypothetical protein
MNHWLTPLEAFFIEDELLLAVNDFLTGKPLTGLTNVHKKFQP